MKNWQDYATNANTNSAKLAPPTPPPEYHHHSQQDPKPNRAWLFFNIFLTILCTVSIIYALIVTFTSKTPTPSFSIFLSNIVVTFIVPGVILTWLFSIITDHDNPSPTGIAIIGLIASIILGVALIANAVIAIKYYHKHRKDYPSFASQNLILALIPPLFVIICLISLLFHRP